MDSTRRMALLAIPAALLVSLSGCALLEPAGSDEPPSALQTCALGHSWTLDLGDLGEQMVAALTAEGVATPAAVVDGSQSLTWNTDGKVIIETDYTITITSTAGEAVTTVTETHVGGSTGEAYINGDVAIPRRWDGTGLSVKATAELDGAALEAVPFVIPPTDFDDSYGLELTCDGDTLTTHPRGGHITQTWSRSDPAE